MHQLLWETNMHHLLWGNKHASFTMGNQTCINYYGETNMHQLLWGNKYASINGCNFFTYPLLVEMDFTLLSHVCLLDG